MSQTVRWSNLASGRGTRTCEPTCIPARRDRSRLLTSKGDFPWGSNSPGTAQRIVVAILIALVAAAIHYIRASHNAGVSDFTPLWYASKMLWVGRDPYPLIGPHRMIDLTSPVFYPAPALVSVLPLTLFSFQWAGTVFVFVSAALLAFGVTREGWQRLPIFPSVAFLTSAQLGQWSILMTAAVFIPAISFLSIAKPQASLPVIASSSRRSTWIAGTVGALLLLIVSFVLLPGWVSSWWHLLVGADYFKAPIASFGGAAIAVVLLRWRRPEAWLVFIAACMPQTWYAYNGLILLIVATTYREACTLSLVSSAAWVVAYFFFVGEWRSEQTRSVLQNVLIVFCYMPAALMVLRRPNVGPTPLWIEWADSGLRRIRHREL